MAVPNMSCPSGGQFYACASGSRFVGCCSTDPCGTNSCPAGNLVVTSFDPAGYSTFADQQCSGGLFFTCAQNNPPFWGCCKSDPCAAGRCSANDLAAAYLSSSPTDAAPFLALNVTGEATTSAISQAASSTRTTATSSPTISEDSPSSRSSSHTGAIVGGAVGGFAVLAALLISLLWLLHRRRDSKTEKQETIVQQSDNSSGSVKYPAGTSAYSPTVPSYPSSPETHLSPSPQLPQYLDKRNDMHFSQELAGSPVGLELESGQKFHPYKQFEP